MHATFVRTVTFVTLALALAAAGCSGKALNRALTPPGTPNAYYDSYARNNYWPQIAYDPGYRTDPLVRFPSDSRLAGYDVGNLLSRHLSEFSGAFGGNFATLHLQL